MLHRPANAGPWRTIAILARSSGEEGGGANVNVAGLSLRSRDNPYLRFPGAVRALVLQR
jgi:hypothetical protein